MLGRFLSKDHTTIIHAVNKFEENKTGYLTHILDVDRMIKQGSK